MHQLEMFPMLSPKNGAIWYGPADILAETEALKEDREYSVALSYFDSSIGMAQVVVKLSLNFQGNRATKASAYKKRRHARHF